MAALLDSARAAYRGPAMAEEECEDLTSDRSRSSISINSSTNTTGQC
eukprot:CAMPEP_0203946224 /NCGR_PEP_ID=MMETSP0359-20131031/81543_1 /ASSEMBLY_ACC=CAM_ASM_000338 /TAXON_ID=268821 /ORGANISM="Scrippsiella Hangoei, Strain SHTV-5" /LENGTH=46 /DNA_ID= /DNA_START= /DNA_END= /DNA_ORIENTATION=